MNMPALESWTIDPGKWPRLLVVGEHITPEQADQILIRTANLYYLDCNDLKWNREVARIVLADEHAEDPASTYNRLYNYPFKQVRARAEALRSLRLEYLHNDRISSSWIGGARGWCDWDGRIGSANYTIGKWPGLDEVGREWAQIAAAFPYLDLTAQLVSDEGAGQVCAQWRVTGGEAVAEPLGASLASAEHLTDVEDEAVMAKFVDQMFDVSAERGVTAERLQRAVAAVEAQSA